MSQSQTSMFDARIMVPALGGAIAKLDPRKLVRNPVIFVVAVVTVLCTVLLARDLVTGGENLGFSFQLVLWLWFTVLFANFAEAVAEGRGKAQAASLRKTRTDTQATLQNGRKVASTSLKVGDLVVVATGEIIPSDGEVIEGVASVNEAAITGESAPAIRESGGDRSAVTGGTQVLSDRIVVRITAAAGSTFIDRMIGLVEGAERQKTPNEIALNILLAGMTLIFVLAGATIPGFAAYAGGEIPVMVLVALFVTLIPTTIGALLSAIGIAGMDRLVRFNVLAMSGRAVEGRATSTRFCWTRPARSPWATARRPSSAPCAASRPRNWPMRRSLPRLPTRRPKGGRSWCWPRRNTASAPATCPACRPPSSPSPPKAG